MFDVAQLKSRLFPTFHSDVDTLVRGELRLHQHVARIFSFIHILLDIKQFQGPIVFESTLPMVVGQQVGVLVPFDGVIWVANDATVDVHVPTSDGSEVFHRSDAGWPFKDTLKIQHSYNAFEVRLGGIKRAVLCLEKNLKGIQTRHRTLR